ncbi:MAG: PRC-barrel domain-containing protein [Candidatus Kapabacteria bacterium]|nr:PRC-barrel domain-containing protein [Candidatus Kapabacteria bacterium]
MAVFTTLYLSRILGSSVLSDNGEVIGKLQDVVVDLSFIRPKVIALKVKLGRRAIPIDFNEFTVTKTNGHYAVVCKHIAEMIILPEHTYFLAKHVMDKQIVDMDGKKLERVNDLRLANLSDGMFVVAVDVGTEGLLRRLSVAKTMKMLLKPVGVSLSSKLILWDDVATIDFQRGGLILSKSQEKISTLHPSDIADIIEDLDRNSQVAFFSSLDEEKAADVLEEMETDAQVDLIESLHISKAADLLEKMPADEVADILDEMEEDKAEEILSEMESQASTEVRELMEYPDNSVGSLMATDFISFEEEMTIEQTINELRLLRPESDTIYYLYILNRNENLIATVSLRDLIISHPMSQLKSIMNRNVTKVYDTDKIDLLGEIISKYNLLAVPVVDAEEKMVGIVIIDDVVFNLMKNRRRKA